MKSIVNEVNKKVREIGLEDNYLQDVQHVPLVINDLDQ
jgi:hypothetical protein